MDNFRIRDKGMIIFHAFYEFLLARTMRLVLFSLCFLLQIQNIYADIDKVMGLRDMGLRGLRGLRDRD